MLQYKIHTIYYDPAERAKLHGFPLAGDWLRLHSLVLCWTVTSDNSLGWKIETNGYVGPQDRIDQAITVLCVKEVIPIIRGQITHPLITLI